VNQKLDPFDKIKDTTDTDRSASYLDLHLQIDNEGLLRTKLYNKTDYFCFPIVEFHLCVATFQQHLYKECISLNCNDITELVVSIMKYWINRIVANRETT
jgi:hypothetical protein